MTLNEKIKSARDIITAAMTEFRRPVVMWSSGKDSMVLLHLLWKHNLPVILHRDPMLPRRYTFANDIIASWNLTVHDWPPAASSIVKRNGHLSIMQRYEIAPGRSLDLPVDLFEVEEVGACGLQDVLLRPKANFTAPWDVFFTGAKSSDADALLGQMPLKVDILRNIGAPSFAFPLRYWTDEDIWQYIETYRVPYQKDRYEQTDTGWHERESKLGNPDYLPGCTRCLDPDGPASVHCPKLNRQVSNVSAQFHRIHQPLPDYIEQEEHHALRTGSTT